MERKDDESLDETRRALLRLGVLGAFGIGTGLSSTPAAATSRPPRSHDRPRESRASTPPEPAWIETYGGDTRDELRAIVGTADRGYAAAGVTASFGSGERDGWLVKTDADGNTDWHRTYEAGEPVFPRALVGTPDGGYVLAGSRGSVESGTDGWLMKTDPEGVKDWSRTYDEHTHDSLVSLARTADGGYALAGRTGDVGANDTEGLVVKTDPEGNRIWSRTVGQSDGLSALVGTPDGGYALAGDTSDDGLLVKTDADGSEEWRRTYGGSGGDGFDALVRTADEGYALAGSTNSFGDGGIDGWLVRTDAAGDKEWHRTYESGGVFGLFGTLVRTTDGGYALGGVAGSISGTTLGVDGWLVKADADGTEEWSDTYDESAEDLLYALVETAGGGYALAGRTGDAGANHTDGLVVNVAGTDAPPPVVGDAPPRDPDGDGLYEDVNGDGAVTPGDATVLFKAVFDGDPVVVNDPGKFDFNGDGELTPGDATVLFDRIF